MTTLREAAQQALEALEDIFGANKVDVGAINALRAALAEQAQPGDPWPQIRRDFEQRMRAEGYTPTCLTWLDGGIYASPAVDREWKYEKLKYTTPPVVPQPLTDEDICRVGEFDGADEWTYWFARAVEAEVIRRMRVKE